MPTPCNSLAFRQVAPCLRDQIAVDFSRRFSRMSQLVGTHWRTYGCPRGYCFGLIESFVSASSPRGTQRWVSLYAGDDTGDKYARCVNSIRRRRHLVCFSRGSYADVVVKRESRILSVGSRRSICMSISF